MRKFRVINKPARDPVLDKMIQPGGVVTVPDNQYYEILKNAKCLGDEIKEKETATLEPDIETRTKADIIKELKSRGVDCNIRQTKDELIDLWSKKS